VPKPGGAALRAVLFTDVVGSTELANELGDERWGRLLAAQFRVLRAALKANRGREVDTAGDGLFAVFESPADAVRCAFVAVRAVQEIGLDIRAGVHFGEIETSGSEVHGIVVHTGARVMALAGPAEVLITQTVKDLVAGSRFQVKERGSYELKGVPGTWAVYDVVSVDDELRPQSIEGATVASERRERASASSFRRSRRWIVPAAAAVALVVAAAVAIVALRPHATFTPTVGTVAKIDDGTFDRPIDAASFPTGLASGEGRIWVLDQQRQIFWVDVASGQVGSRGAAGTPTGATVGGGFVWITNGFGTGVGPGGWVSRLDPESQEIRAEFDTPVGSESITWGADAVWVSNQDAASVTRYGQAQRVPETFPLPSGTDPPEPGPIAFSSLDGEVIWIGDSAHDQIFRMDANDPNSVKTSSIGATASAIAVGFKSIWVVSETADAVYVLDPSSGGVRTSIDVGASGCNAPSALAIGGDGVWVACSLSQEVVRIDAMSAAIAARLPVDGAPDALATDEDGHVWVAVRPR
jgi:class 3 adenylate cyclase